MKFKLRVAPKNHYIVVIWQHFGGAPFAALVPVHELSYAYLSCLRRSSGKYITDKKMPDDVLIVRDAFFSELPERAWLKPYRCNMSDLLDFGDDIIVKSIYYTGQVP
jgi:hypothetical protein